MAVKLMRVAIGGLLLAMPTVANAEIQANVREMVEAAIAGGNDTEIATVVKFAKRVDPSGASEIDELVTSYRTSRTERRQQALREASMFEQWEGQGDVGGSRTTGTSDTVGITAGLYLHRDGLKWGHKIRVRGDYQESNGDRTRESLLASYEPSYKVDDRLFIYGLGQVERDPLLGFARRISLSSGVGYRLFNDDNFRVDVDAGPAFRATRFTPGNENIPTDDDQTLAARGSLGVRWTLSPTVKFTNDSTGYVESSNSTFATTTALDARIIGALSARLSYNVQYESHPPVDRQNLDTISRVALVYDF